MFYFQKDQINKKNEDKINTFDIKETQTYFTLELTQNTKGVIPTKSNTKFIFNIIFIFPYMCVQQK